MFQRAGPRATWFCVPPLRQGAAKFKTKSIWQQVDMETRVNMATDDIDLFGIEPIPTDLSLDPISMTQPSLTLALFNWFYPTFALTATDANAAAATVLISFSAFPPLTLNDFDPTWPYLNWFWPNLLTDLSLNSSRRERRSGSSLDVLFRLFSFRLNFFGRLLYSFVLRFLKKM